MRIAARRGLLAVLLLTATEVCAAGSGDLDPIFNGGAPVLLDLAGAAPKTTSFAALAPAPDGGIMMAGTTINDAGDMALLLLRPSATGSLGPAFADGGVRIVLAGRGDATLRPISYAFRLLQRPDWAGWFVSGGGSFRDGRQTMVAIAFTPNGELDLDDVRSQFAAEAKANISLVGAP